MVDEVPAEVREEHALLAELAKRYQLMLAHFQSRFLPSGWGNRLHPLEPFGRIQASLVDVYDVFLRKLFSGRDKDRDDLRALLPALDRGTLRQRLRDICAALLAEEKLRENAARNWYIVRGEELP